MNKYFCILILLFFIGCNSNEQVKSVKPQLKAESSASEFRPIDQLIESELQKSGTPGATLVVVHNSKIVHAQGYGFADVESRLKADLNTVWPLASITKVLTSIAVMQLVDSDKIKLNADVNTYLKRVRVPNTFPKPITVADLLRHTSGLDELPGRRFDRAEDVPPFDKFLSAHLVRYRPPGEFTSYSSYGISLAGLLVEEVSGSTYSDYLRTHLFEPLGMKTARVMTKPGDEKGIAAPYEIEDGKAKRMDYEWYVTPAVASAVMSTNDMAKLLIDLTSQNPKVISQNSLKQMLSTQATLHPAVPGWGYGFQIDQFNNHNIAEHGGDIGGFASLMSIVADSRLGIYIVHHGEGSSLRFRVRNAILEKYFPGKPAPPAAIKNVDVSAYAGNYRASFQCHTCPDGGPPVPEFEVTVNKDATLELWGSRWIPIGADLFARDDGRAHLAFMRDSKRNVIALSGGSWRVGERVMKKP